MKHCKLKLQLQIELLLKNINQFNSEVIPINIVSFEGYVLCTKDFVDWMKKEATTSEFYFYYQSGKWYLHRTSSSLSVDKTTRYT